MSHTPGPWKFTNGKYIDAHGHKIAIRIAEIYNWTPNYLNNAHLISASPDLLEALEALLEGRPTEEPPNEMGIAHRNWVLFEKGRQAIRKAKNT